MQPERAPSGVWRWHWRGVWILGCTRVVLQLRNAGEAQVRLKPIAGMLEQVLAASR